MSEHDPVCPDSEVPGSGCLCPWLAAARADERERIAQAIEALKKVAEIRWRNEQHVYWEGARDAHHDAARIARQGGRGE